MWCSPSVACSSDVITIFGLPNERLGRWFESHQGLPKIRQPTLGQALVLHHLLHRMGSMYLLLLLLEVVLSK